MGKESSICLQSFTLGFGVLSYFIVACNNYNYFIINWLNNNVITYCIGFYIIINIIIAVVYRGESWKIAVISCFIGYVASIGIITSILCDISFMPFGIYIIVLSIFHFSEYLTTSITNPSTLSLDSFLLNHSVAYWTAAVASWTEFFLERWLFPAMKKQWYVLVLGICICIFGEALRKLAMITASTNFNHNVQKKKHRDHQLVTWGVYNLFRHPSYVGWFWWSIGTQVILANPICVAAYAAASWAFFNERINYEENTLIKFFGQRYLDYRKRVGTGIPFIKGYQLQLRVHDDPS